VSEIETILDSYKSICAVCEEKESSCEECFCGILIRAVEKQIPKKSEDIDEEYSLFQCPSCNELILYSDDKESHKYCLNCGQKLDWSV
jgi:hypothetical protein